MNVCFVPIVLYLHCQIVKQSFETSNGNVLVMRDKSRGERFAGHYINNTDILHLFVFNNNSRLSVG